MLKITPKYFLIEPLLILSKGPFCHGIVTKYKFQYLHIAKKSTSLTMMRLLLS